MNLTPVTNEEAATLLRHSFGLTEQGDLNRADYAQWIRCEVLGCRRLRRATLFRQLQGYSDLLKLDLEMATSVLDELIQRGDILLARGGLLYPTPCRVVRTGDAVGILLGSVLREHLLDFPGLIEEEGAARLYRATEALSVWLTSMEGCEVRPEDWSGLSSAPVAADDLLSGFSRGQTSSFDYSIARRFRPETKTWHSEDDQVQGLWRVKLEAFTIVYYYGSPRQARLLSYDEAIRTQHALVRSTTPYEASVRREGSAVTLQLPCRVPWSEYRHLSLHAKAQDDRTLVFAGDAWPGIQALLSARLGIRFHEVSG